MTKNLNAAIAIAIVGAMSLAALPQAAAAQPMPTMASEAAAHPNIASAIRKMESAYADLDRAPDVFGGNKGAAMNQIKAAIHSLRKALFYRLKITNAQIDSYRF